MILQEKEENPMIHVSEPLSTPPETFRTPLQRQVYETLAAQAIPFQRVETDEVITMEDCARVSFALAEEMETVLGTRIGAATVLSVLLPSAGNVRLMLDRDVLTELYYGCSDGTTTGYLKLRTEDVLRRFLPAAGRTPDLITV